MIDYLPHRALLRLLAVMALVMAAHLTRLPPWESAAVVLLLLWRGLASARQWSLPPQPLKLALAIAAFAGVYFSYGRINGQVPGLALLVLMLALKLTEMRSRRDVIVVVFLLYFLLVTHFLFSQELWTIVYLLLSATAITSVLIDSHHPGEPLPLRRSLRMGGTMIAQSLPPMVLFFILFPRIPGPLWGVPADSGPSRSGLSDSMSPGDISRLKLSRDIAFRVRFDGPPPPASQLYWRGPVFREFGGRSWTQTEADLLSREPAQIEVQDDRRTHYELTLEPMRSRWLFALDLPDPRQLPPGARIDRTGALVLDKPITERQLVRGVAVVGYRLDPTLGARARARDTRLPQGSNPRTVALAARWREQGLDDQGIVDAALRMIHDEPFVYTLEPPRLGRHSADEFLFDTRRGYCEHYSSAFTILMRAAGIPARVVTGYQGMEPNEVGGYFLVRQSDAHAWSEVWLAGRGWVRVDPTAAVAPERIERALLDAETSLARERSGFSMARFQYFFEARWDWANARWNEWVLAYGPELQRQFLSHFGLDDMRNMLLALTVSVSLALALVGLAALRKSAPPKVTERALVLWHQAQRRLQRLGLEQRPDEGPRDFVHRVIGREPALQDPLLQLLDAYLRLRYAGERDTALERVMVQAIEQIRRT